MNNQMSDRPLRWDPYFFRKGHSFVPFWKDYLTGAKRDILFVLAGGIDPRMCFGIEQLISLNGSGKRDCTVMVFDEGVGSATGKHQKRADDNILKLKALLNARGAFKELNIPVWTDSGPSRRRIGATKSIHFFKDIATFAGYSDIIIDISSMRRGIYLSFIGHVMQLLESYNLSNDHKINLHVLCANSPDIDRQIAGVGIDETADYVTGFSSDLEMHSTIDVPKIWIPILGSAQEDKLERIYTLLKPTEICPVLPSPSLNGKRADEMIKEYWRLLLDTWGVEPGNVVYASEDNPFDIYRQVHRIIKDYGRALKPIGGCKAAISVLGSKVLSIGALLACYELRNADVSVGIAHVESQGYDTVLPEGQISLDGVILTTTWVIGECYCE